MAVFFKGIGLGLLLAMLIGPVFFALIQTSIRKGFKAGAWLAVGISLSDIIYIVICYIGLSNLLDSSRFKDILGIVGGALMIVFGVITFMKPIVHKTDVPMEERRGTFRFILKGFALNAINPFVLIFWVGVIGGVSPDYKMSEIYLFFSGLIATTFTCDLLKVQIATRLSKILTPKYIKMDEQDRWFWFSCLWFKVVILCLGRPEIMIPQSFSYSKILKSHPHKMVFAFVPNNKVGKPLYLELSQIDYLVKVF